MKTVVMFSTLECCFNEALITGEKEYLIRAVRALENMNIDYIVTDPFGNVYDLKTNHKTGLTCDDFEVIAHFSTHITEMPFFDTYSVVALWNPVLYLSHIETLQTKMGRSKQYYDTYECFDDYITPSQKQWSIFSDYIGADKMHFSESLPYMPTVSELDIVEPNNKFEKIFYIGIGWEKEIPGKPARHAYELSNLSKLNLLDIYGPQRFWEKRQDRLSYKGEIPQDGKSIYGKINQSGITLALASAEHIRGDIVTNRVFEGIAAGSIIISNLKDQVFKMFGDNVLYIDYTLSEPERLQQILTHYQWIQDNPEQARQKIINCQNILREKYCLEVLLKNILDALPARQQTLKQNRELISSDKSIDVVYIASSERTDIKSDLQQILKQNYHNLHLIVFAKKQAEYIQGIFDKYKQNNQSITIVQKFNDHQEFSLYYQYLQQNNNNQYLTFFSTGTKWKHNHLSILMRLLDDNPNQKMAVAKSSNYVYDISYKYQPNDVLFNDYQAMYTDVRNIYVNLSTMIIDREYFFKTINDNSFGSLDYLSGLYLLMFAVYDKMAIVSQYMTVSNPQKQTKQYLKDLAWEKILMIKYLFPKPIHVVLTYDDENDDAGEKILSSSAQLNNARIEYMRYKKRWKNKNIWGKITSFYKLRKLRNKYKKVRDK